MRLYLVRHGQPRRDGATDADRRLAPLGERQVERLGRALLRLAAQPRWLVTSPATRCCESAGILATALRLPAEAVTVEPALGLEGSAAGGTTPFAVHAGAADGLLVGHEPWLAAFGAVLLGGATHANLRFACASCACFEVHGTVDAPRGVLAWLLGPEQLERLGQE